MRWPFWIAINSFSQVVVMVLVIWRQLKLTDNELKWAKSIYCRKHQDWWQHVFSRVSHQKETLNPFLSSFGVGISAFAGLSLVMCFQMHRSAGPISGGSGHSAGDRDWICPSSKWARVNYSFSTVPSKLMGVYFLSYCYMTFHMLLFFVVVFLPLFSYLTVVVSICSLVIHFDVRYTLPFR